MNVINFEISQNNIHEVLKSNPDCQFFHVANTEKFASDGDSLITLARRNPHAHEILLALANKGFYLYMVKENYISSFVQHKSLEKLWNPVKNGQVLSHNGLLYTITPPKINVNPKLLVIFSSISGKMYQPSLHRYFEQNYRSIEKYISPNTIILRIVDVGAVTGAYYFNTNYLELNEYKIQDLIFKTEEKYKTQKTVLFGISKGATGAFYHANLGNYDFVAVDPIVDDEHYLVRHKDLHFVKGCFPETKIEKFRRVLKAKADRKNRNGCLITSKKSPQFKYIEREVIEPYKQDYSIFITDHPEIKDHPDVAPNSMHMMTTLVNNLINGIDVKKKIYPFL